MKKPKLGDKVTFNKFYVRKVSGWKKEYKLVKCDDNPSSYGGKPVLKEGVYIGQRTITNGVCDNNDYDGGLYWIPKKFITCALVVFDEYRKPIHIPFDELSIKP